MAIMYGHVNEAENAEALSLPTQKGNKSDLRRSTHRSADSFSPSSSDGKKKSGFAPKGRKTKGTLPLAIVGSSESDGGKTALLRKSKAGFYLQGMKDL